MSLSKKVFGSIQRALHNLTFRVALSETWREIHNELGVGSISSKQLILTREDHAKKLRSWASLRSGADPLNRQQLTETD